MRNKIILSSAFTLSFVIFLGACGNEANVKYQRYYADGSQVYKIYCENCHMSKGEGLADLIPALTDTTFLRENRAKLPCFVNNGLKDSIQINGKIYQSLMPAEKNLAAIDVAKVLTYVTNSFGNNQGIYDVKEVENQLNQCN
ncbi:MAG: cytochrome c [Sphingobacteriales bacterium]|nr:cytochrome c [Sphingobacteriales bacterium]